MRDKKANGRIERRPNLKAWAAMCALAVPPALQAQTWISPGTGSWFDAANWDLGVPLAGGAVVVSNNGTATLAGPPATPLLGSLSIGLGGTGTGVGQVVSFGVGVFTSGFLGIGSVFTDAALADGRLLIGGGAGGSAGSVFSGSVINAAIAANGTGQLVSEGSFTIGSGTLSVAQIFNAARGSVASGTVVIGGDAGTASFLVAGTAFSTNANQVGSRATGVVDIGGNLTLAPNTFAFIGATGFPDRVADGSGGFHVDQASGAVEVGGTLTVAGGQWLIGTTNGGVAEGSFVAGALSMAPGTSLSGLQVGTSGAGGQAIGTVQSGGGVLRVTSLLLGNSFGGTALGRLELDDTDLFAGTVSAGIGDGVAQMLFDSSQSSVTGDMALLAGLLALDRSHLGIGDAFNFGNAGLMRIGVDGLARGTEYGAIDAARVQLDGQLEVDFLDLVFNGSSAVFDLIRSGSADGIAGDFAAFALLHLPTGYSASAGLEVDGGIEVYRVRLSRNDVPEPGSWLLTLMGLGLVAGVRRRRPQLISK